MNFDRINNIWYYLKEKNTHNTKKVIKWGRENNYSDTQIRRDLHKLENMGHISLKYGLITVLSTENEIGHERAKNKIENRNSKETIAKKAISLIKDDEILFCSAGSTTQTFITNLNKNVNTFITNGLDSFVSAKKSNFIKNKILIGGDWCPDNSSFVGSIAEEQIKIFNFNKAVISCDYIDEDLNVYINNYRECKIISNVLRNTKEVILLVDSSKFNKKGLVILTQLDNVNFVVIDEDKINFLEKYENFSNINIL